MLVAEDDPHARRILEVRLAQWGYDVVGVADGEAALAALGSEDAPRLVVLDWMMPGMDGVEVCRTIRGIGGRYHYVVMVTAKTSREALLLGLSAGADDYVAKPFDPEELRLRLQAGARILGNATNDPLVCSAGQVLQRLRNDLQGACEASGPLSVLRLEIAAPVSPQTAQAELLSAVCGVIRRADAVGLWGDGVVVLLPGCDPAQGQRVAERIRDQARRRGVVIAGGLATALTASPPEPETLLGAAVDAAHLAIARGGDRIEFFGVCSGAATMPSPGRPPGGDPTVVR